MLLELTLPQAEIIKEICRMELLGLQELIDSPPDKDLYEIWQEAAKQTGLNHSGHYYLWLKEGHKIFTRVLNRPELLVELITGDYMRIFRHILATHEETIFAEKPIAVKNLWRKIFFYEDWEEMKKVGSIKPEEWGNTSKLN